MPYRLVILLIVLLLSACSESQVSLSYLPKAAFSSQANLKEIEKPQVKPVLVAKVPPSGLITMGPVQNNQRSVIFNLNIPKVSMLEKAIKAQSFKTQALDTAQINFVRIKIEGDLMSQPMYPAGTLSDPDPTKDKLITNPGLPFTVNLDNIPFGQIRIATIESFDATKTLIPGTTIKAVFQVNNPVTIIEINFKTTPAGLVLEQMLASDANKAKNVDQTALQSYIDGLTGVAGVKPSYTYTLHPSLINTANIATDLLAANGNVASLVAGPTHTMVGGTFNANIVGLVGPDTAVLTAYDPASGIATNVANGVFNLNPITPGTWTFIALAPGYTVTGAPASFTVAAGGTFNAGTITFTPATPNISSLSATSGKIATSININGTNFHSTIAGNVVSFGGTTATVTAASPTQLTVNVPSGIYAANNVNVTVGSQTSNSISFAVKPDITGVASNGTVINGTGFDPTPANNTVLYNSTATTVNTATTTQLNVTVPGSVSGTVPLTNQVGTQISDSVNVNLALFPNITSLSVTNGIIGSTLQINGTSFDATLGNNVVKFGTTTATVNSGTTTQLDVTVPAGIDTVQGVTVTIGANQSNSINFNVTPNITSLSLANARIGDTIQVNGTGFNATPGNNTVKFGSTNAAVTAASATQLSVTVPAGIFGNQPVTVQVGTQTSAGSNFDVTPDITSLSATNGVIGSTIQINGTGFHTTPGSNTVKFGTTTATVNTASTTQLDVTVPAGIDSVQGVTVQVGAQTSNSVNFNVTPNITSLSAGNAIIGSTIQINGTGFHTTAGSNTVKFGSTSATVTAASATQLDVTVPAGIFGTVAITVQVGSQTSAGSNFDVKPNITGFSVGGNPIGNTIQINGNGFHTTAGNNTVQFSGVGATVSSASTTQLSVVIPTAPTGNVTVQVGSHTSNGVSFNVVPLISISAPAASALVNGNVTVSANVTSGNAITQVEFFVNGSSIGVDASSPYSVTWDTTTGPSGARNLTATVTDSIPNNNNSSAVSVTVNQVPVITSLTASVNPVSGLSFPVLLNCAATDSDNTLVSGSYTWSVDGGPVGTFTSTTGTQVYWTAPSSAGGPYTIRCSVSDGVNTATEQTVNVSVNSGTSTVTGNGGFQ